MPIKTIAALSRSYNIVILISFHPETPPLRKHSGEFRLDGH
jgi:hypothetical protein